MTDLFVEFCSRTNDKSTSLKVTYTANTILWYETLFSKKVGMLNLGVSQENTQDFSSEHLHSPGQCFGLKVETSAI